MSLYEIADGLLDTHVTWQDIEYDIQKALNTTARFGDNKKVTNISEMKGFLSRISLIEPDWVGGATDEQLPDKFVAKLSTELALYDFSKITHSDDNKGWNEEKMKSMTIMVQECHNREVEMYRILMRENMSGLPFTKIYSLKSFDENNQLKAYILSEYIPNIHHIDIHENISYIDIIPVLECLATFSSMGERMNKEELDGLIGEVYIEEAIKYLYCESSPKELKNQLLEILSSDYEEVIDEAMDIFELICSNEKIQKRYSTMSTFLGHRPVLQHSDVWTANMLFSDSTSSTNSLEFKALIDFQTASLGSPGLDVSSLFITCLSKMDRRDKFDQLINHYYTTFINNLDEKTIYPYSIDNLYDSYNLCFIPSAIFMLPFIVSFAKKSGENIPTSSIEKMIGIIEDVVDIHRINTTKYPGFFDI